MIRWYLLIWSAGEAAHDKEYTVEQNTLVIAGGRERGEGIHQSFTVSSCDALSVS